MDCRYGDDYMQILKANAKLGQHKSTKAVYVTMMGPNGARKICADMLVPALLVDLTQPGCRWPRSYQVV